MIRMAQREHVLLASGILHQWRFALDVRAYGQRKWCKRLKISRRKASICVTCEWSEEWLSQLMFSCFSCWQLIARESAMRSCLQKYKLHAPLKAAPSHNLSPGCRMPTGVLLLLEVLSQRQS